MTKTNAPEPDSRVYPLGLKHNPFRHRTDVPCLFLSRGHRRALEYLRRTALSTHGFMVLGGDPGVGKTALLQHFLRGLSDLFHPVYISQTNLPAIELLKIFLFELTGTYVADGEAELLIRLREALDRVREQDKRPLLVIDEAQNLEAAALEQLRLLVSDHDQQGTPLSIVLSGHSGLLTRLEAPALEAVRQRVQMRVHLPEMDALEVRKYLNFRLLTGGGEQVFQPWSGPMLKTRSLRSGWDLLDAGFIQVVYQNTRGVPRLINMLCEVAFSVAEDRGEPVLSVAHLEEAMRELGWKDEEGQPTQELTETSLMAFRMEPLLSVEATDREGETRVETFFHVPLQIGRIRQNDLVLDDSTVSKHHARIVREGSNFYIEDLGSTNGVRINGKRVRRARLAEGAAVRLGKYLLRIAPVRLS